MPKHSNQTLASITPHNASPNDEDALDFTLTFPQGHLSRYIQGLWSASNASHTASSITRWLQADACSGICFVLNGAIQIDTITYNIGTFFIPISTTAHTLTLQPNTKIMGIRFQPGIGNRVLEGISTTPIGNAFKLHDSIFNDLAIQLNDVPIKDHTLNFLKDWLAKKVTFDHMLPASFYLSLDVLTNPDTDRQAPIGQRQIERLFKNWVGISPKMFQRILRVKHTLAALKKDPHMNLVELALNHGYADQAHMTREIKFIARITPKHYSRLVHQRDT